MKRTRIAILGAGSWGSAVAIHLSRSGHEVMLWSHSSEHAQQMKTNHCNTRYLADFTFPENLLPTDNLSTCLEQAEHIIIAVPSHAFGKLLTHIHRKPLTLAWLTKGIDPSSHQLLSQLVMEQWGETLPFAIISGPSFAREVAQALPTAIVIAGNHMPYLKTLQTVFHQPSIRAYLSTDFIGVQLCGAVKNVLAIACGISDGLKYGANTKAALITRGLAEMSRLGARLGASSETFMGLAGVGDLVLTCTDDQSRNRRFGLQLGQGVSPVNAEKNIQQVVEGKFNAAQVCALASQHQVDMPICQAVNAILNGTLSAEQAVNHLMDRPARSE